MDTDAAPLERERIEAPASGGIDIKAERIAALSDIVADQEATIFQLRAENNELQARLEVRDDEMVAAEEYTAIIRARLRELAKLANAEQHGEQASDVLEQLDDGIIDNTVDLALPDRHIEAQREQWLRRAGLYCDPQELTFAKALRGGTTANVYKALLYGSECAVKMIKSREELESSDPALASRIEIDVWREVCCMYRLRHPNIIALLGVVYSSSSTASASCTVELGKAPMISTRRALVFEYAEKGTLDVKKCSTSFTLVLQMSLGIARGMAFAHARGVIHRDLKPSNVLISKHGEPKVADWGLSKVMMGGKTSGVMTGETGTYLWMAPEVLKYEPYNESCDVYSFGIMLWNLMYGSENPYLLTPLQVAKGVAKNALRPKIPTSPNPEFRTLMEQCWHEEPSKRPPFVDVCARLEIILADHNIHKSAAGGLIKRIWG